MRNTEIEEAPPPSPAGMCSSVKDGLKGRQWRDPVQWSLTVKQWIAAVDLCLQMTELADSTAVTWHAVQRLCVKKWSAGTGCGIALLMNHEFESHAKLMISHVSHHDQHDTDIAGLLCISSAICFVTLLLPTDAL